MRDALALGLELTRSVVPVAWESAGQATLFLLAGALAALLAARRPARAHRLLLLAMIAAMATPILYRGVRGLGWGLLANEYVNVNVRKDLIVNQPGPVTVRSRFDEVPARMLLPMREVSRGRGLPAPPVAARPRSAPPPVAPAPAPAPAVPWRVRIAWPLVALGAWGLLSVLAAARLGGSLWLGRRLVASARPFDGPSLGAAADEARRRLGLATRPEIRASGRVRCPLVWCWGRRPLLLVPEGIPTRSSAIDWVAVFCHELAHWKRRDHLSGLVGEVLACALPWHPLAWWARARLVALSELACDDWVLASGRPAADYAESLLGLLPQSRPALLPSAVSSRGGLVGRVRHILDGHIPDPNAGRAWTALATAAVVLIATVTALAQTRPAQDRDEPREEPMPKAKGEAAPAPETRPSLSGTVLDPDGRPAAGVSVWWVARRKPKLGFVAMTKEEVASYEDRDVTRGQGRTDADGRFAFEAEYDPEGFFPSSILVAWGPGFGVLGKKVRGDDRELSLRLAREVPIRGRILTPTGMPAGGVKVALHHIQDVQQEGVGVGSRRNEENYPDYWPRPRTTDADGRFTIEGVPAGVFATIELTHPDYAVDEVTVTTGPKTSPAIEGFEIVPVPAEFEHVLEPARPVEGTVTAADTGQPMADLLVEMVPMRSHGGMPFYTRTDESGRYRVSGHQADHYFITAHPQPGSGYLTVGKQRRGWPAGAKSLVVDFKLDRGKSLRGRVVDDGTGQPVAGCGLVYQPKRDNPHSRSEYDLRDPVRTDDHGAFRVTALPGEGTVAVEAPDRDYIRVTLPKTGRGTAYPHGFAEVKIAEEGEPGPVEVRLRKGVTLEARAVDPDGETVKGVVAYYKGIDASLITKWDHGRTFADGLFRLRGADPDQTYRVYFIHPKRRLATVADLKYDAKAETPIDVKLTPTASVRGRLIDTAGNPVTSAQVYPQIVVTEKEGELSRNDLFNEDNALHYANFLGQENHYVLDRQDRPNDRGEFSFEALVPGVRFYVSGWSGGRSISQFVSPLQPGEVRDLGDLTLKEREP